jgi:hypothetical protein
MMYDFLEVLNFNQLFLKLNQFTYITLFKAIIVFYEIDNIIRNILHIKFEYKEYSIA